MWEETALSVLLCLFFFYDDHFHDYVLPLASARCRRYGESTSISQSLVPSTAIKMKSYGGKEQDYEVGILRLGLIIHFS
jgi:hypothetical protein